MADTTLIETAKRWLRAGFSVIPVQSDKKAYSAWKPYQMRPYQIEEVERAFSDPRAKYVAIVCGYGGVFCFDFDPDKDGIAKEAFNLEQDFFIPWRDTADSIGVEIASQQTRSGGTHVLMITPEPVGNIKLAGVEATPDPNGKVRTHTTIETRGSGGYFLLYDLDLDPNSLPSISNEQFQTLLEAAADLDRVPEPSNGFQNAVQKRQHSGKKAHAAQDGLIGWFNSQHQPQEILERNRYRRVRDKYLCPDSTSGNAGVFLFQDSAGFWMCYSHHGDALGDGHAHDAFDTYKVLEHGGSFETALGEVKRQKDGDQFTFTKGRAREGNFSLRSNSENTVPDATTICPQPLRSNTKSEVKEPDLTSNEAFDLKQVRLKDVASGTGEMAFDLKLKTASSEAQSQTVEVKSESPAQQIIHALNPIRRWAERDEPPPVQWLVHNLIQDNAENLIAGEPGVGKSWISGDLAVSIATGTQFLGRYTSQGPVLIINLDDPSESLPRMFTKRSAKGRGYDFGELPIYYWQPEEKLAYPAEGIITPEVFEYLLNQCDLIKPRLIIVDAFSSAFPSLDGNKGQDSIRAFEALRQLRMAGAKSCSLVLLDHTPKATMQDSKRRGVSGSQQKHAKTRTVHIVRRVEPGEVNGDDVLEWEVFKANAAPYQDNFGVDREMNSMLETASLTQRDLPATGKTAVANRAAKAAITYLKGRPGENVNRGDLLKEVISLSNSSKASAERGLNSSEFIDHPGIQRLDLGGRGSPIGFMWIAPAEPSQSFYSKLRGLVAEGRWQKDLHALREEFRKAEAGDEGAKDKLDAYLSHAKVREVLAEM